MAAIDHQTIKALAYYDAVKSLALQQLAKRKSESIIWNFSGSTLIHLLIILGLGFYVALPEPSIPRRTIAINLNTITELGSETQIGEGKQPEKTSSQPPQQNRQEIIHTDKQVSPLESGAFLLAPQKLIDEIKENNKTIKETERIGFLGVYDVHPAYRQYQQYWQSYVSQFGTKHYPKSLFNNGLSGSLELDIAIDRNGKVRSTDIHRSSGNPEIDNAAIKIALLASPYAPLPEEMAEDIDILHIIRTWEFNNNTLTSHARQ